MFRRAAARALPLAVFAIAAVTAEAGERTPEDMLRGLYAQYDGHAHGHDAHRVDVKAMMTPQLAHAYARVTRAVAGDAPPLDWDIFVNGQDYDVQHLNLSTAQAGKGETVTAAFDNLGQPVTVIYAFAHTPGGWRIDDIRYPPDRTFPKGFSLQAFARHAG